MHGDWEAAEHKEVEGQWHAERVRPDGRVDMVIFSGLNANWHATRYAALENFMDALEHPGFAADAAGIATKYNPESDVHVALWEDIFSQGRSREEAIAAVISARVMHLKAQVQFGALDTDRMEYIQSTIDRDKQRQNGGFVTVTLEIRNNATVREAIDDAIKHKQETKGEPWTESVQ